MCGLSDVLEPTSQSLLKYFLSSRACEGIIRRATKRGKDLPPLLDTALTEMIAWWKAQDSERPDKDSGSLDARPSEQKARTGQAAPATSPSRRAELELEEIAEDAGTTPEKIKELLAQSESPSGGGR